MKFIAMETSKAEVYRNGSADAYGQPPEISISDGGGYPCRHCLNDIPNGKHMLLLAYRPVDENQPYADTGPVFLCADPCKRFDESAHLPPAIARG